MLRYCLVLALLCSQCLSEKYWTKRFSELCQGADKQYYVDENLPQCCPCSPCNDDLQLDIVVACKDPLKYCISYPVDCVSEENFHLIFTPKVTTTTTIPTTTMKTTTPSRNFTSRVATSNYESREEVPIGSGGIGTTVMIGLIVLVVVLVVIVFLFVICSSRLRKTSRGCLTKLRNCLLVSKTNTNTQPTSQGEADILIERSSYQQEGANAQNGHPAPNRGSSIDDSSYSGPRGIIAVPDIRPSPRESTSLNSGGDMIGIQENRNNDVIGVFPNRSGNTIIAPANMGGTVNIGHIYVYNGSNPTGSQNHQNEDIPCASSSQNRVPPDAREGPSDSNPSSGPLGQSSDTTACRPIFLLRNDVQHHYQSQNTHVRTPQRQPSENSSTASSEHIENQAFGSQSDDVCRGECYSEAQPFSHLPSVADRDSHREQHRQPVPVQHASGTEISRNSAVRQCSQEDSSIITILRPPEDDYRGCS